MPMKALAATFAAQQRRLRLLVIASLLLLGALLIGVLQQQRDLAIQREGQRLQTQVRVIDANLSQQLAAMSSALQSMRDDKQAMAQMRGADSQASMRLRALSDAMPGVRTMLVTDAQGLVQASSRPEAIGFDASVRAYFQIAKNKPEPSTLYVSEPFRTAFNVYSLNLVRAWNDQGRFGGVISATLDPNYFQVLLRSVLYADDMRATLIHGQGRAFLTLPANPAIEGSNLARTGTLFSRHRASGQVETLAVGNVGVTGDDRIVVYRTVQPDALQMDQPLLLAVSRSLDGVLAEWRQWALVCGLVYVLASLGLMFSLVLLQRKHKTLMELTRERAQDAVDHAERLDLVLAGADLGLWDMNMQSGTLHVNARAQQIVGRDPAGPAPNMVEWTALIHPDDLPQVLSMRKALEEGRADILALDYRVQHADGRWIWVHSRGKIIERGPFGQPLRTTGTLLDITDRKAAEAQVTEFAFYDQLTQLPNRRLLMDRMHQAQRASSRSEKAVALLFLDLDRFKWINDALGHDLGDALLVQVAQRLKACVRQSDTVARLGGDQFVLLLDQLGGTADEVLAQVQETADKILQTLAQPVRLGTDEHEITASIGIVVFRDEAQAVAVLMKQADAALYLAKSSGRNQARIYSPPADADAADSGLDYGR